ncbi:MAG: FkbM family methyltransferase [Pyrinomonadaceae bacterium]|nr:FkbM family methyltransferase [Pyrinomonadaceae bacterium]
MNISNLAKSLVRKPLNAVGLNLVRVGNSKLARQFALTEETRFLWLASLGLRTVFDVGAHAGEFARMIHKILPGVAIISFEPLAEPFERLQRNTGRIPDFRAFNCALGAETSTQEMHHNEYSQSSSLLAMADLHRESFPFAKRVTDERVEVRRLDDVARDVLAEEEILIKIDVQGYEEEVLLGGEDLIARSRLLIIEVSFKTLYEGQPLFDDIYQHVREKGFKYMGNLDQVLSPADGSVLQADAIFIRQ